jgi:N-acetyl-anhydromuramyl-L-alanine amidase AmpD
MLKLPPRDVARLLSLVVAVAAAVLTMHLAVTRAQARPAPVAAKAASLDVRKLPAKSYTRGRSAKVDTVVVHYTSAIRVDKSRWDDPALNRDIFNRYRVSANYLIGRDGTVYKLVDEANTAWHAGGSIMPAPDNRRNVNRFSLGIEVIHAPGTGYTEAQYASLKTLIADIKTRHIIGHIVGHDEIGDRRAVKLGLRKDVKPDPGAEFDWSQVR